jgi:hypothetical protein
MAREDVIVKSGKEYDHYFPTAKLLSVTKKRGAKVSDTLMLIHSIVRDTAYQTKRFAKEVIQADTVEQTCKNIWDFVYGHIAYKKDEAGKEQVRSPARTWHDRHNVGADGKRMGVDCDCMSVFVVSVLYNLGIKNIFFRITKYTEPHYEHIYPVVFLPDRRQITIDCVVNRFNYETPYTQKKDTAMDLEYLNGVNDPGNKKLSDFSDLMGLMGDQEAFSTLGKVFRRKANNTGGGGNAPSGGKRKRFAFKKSPEQKQKRREKIARTKKFLGKGLHITNRINPVTVALRNGVLAGMKLNFMQIGSNLRWTYLSDEQAAQKGILMDRFRKLKAVRQKLEKIFYGAGGKPENLKKAILSGRGNRDRAVPLNGLGYVSDEQIMGLNEDMPLNQLLGRDIYHSENIEGLEGIDGLEGFSELGDLGSATAASITAASGALTAIAALIKNIGSIFPNKKSGKQRRGAGGGSGGGSSESGGEADSSSNANDNENSGGESDASSNDSGSQDSSGGQDNGSGDGASNESADESKSGENSTEDGGDSTNGSTGTGVAIRSGSAVSNPNDISEEEGGENNKTNGSIMEKTKAFWQNNKKLIKGTGIALGTVGLIALAYKLLKSKKKKVPQLNGPGKKHSAHKPKAKTNLLSGIKSKKKGGHKKSKHKIGHKKHISLF